MVKLSKQQVTKLYSKHSLDRAKYILSLFDLIIKKSNEQNLNKNIKEAEQQIKEAFATDPFIINIVSYLEQKGKSRKEIQERLNYVHYHLATTHQIIANHGISKIKNSGVVLTHGFSSSVLAILLEAKKQNINFQVFVTETRPSFEGRKMAEILIKHKIPVTYFLDSAIRQCIKRADVILAGATALSEQGQVYNIIGSELIAELANAYDVPLYVCMDSWKFNPNKIHEADKEFVLGNKDLWNSAPKSVRIAHYKYEKISPRLITGIISDFGIFKPNILVHQIKQENSWM